ncbi:MAG: heparinase II/III family protein [Lachnospiraceae bacterium]|nr:heparinase II/III family protein [Lachnospiraceae bacterium]
MPKAKWLINRLTAMSAEEVIWRLSQLKLQRKEKRAFKKKPILVTAKIFNKSLQNLVPDEEFFYLNLSNPHFSLSTSLPLLGGYHYKLHKKDWHYGFQTSNHWPKTFSYELDYKQCDDIGDARTNWELNRHLQFALLAKNYFASLDKKYLDEFESLFKDWNNENPFLHGISWTSVMEFAIRASNWCYAYCFLKARGEASKTLLEELKIGIINMTDYVVSHYSRYSSANNHLVVEAFSIAQSGILFRHKPWVDLGISLLTRELPLQNYADGVNKELSLHYQSFYMEAMGLILRLLQKNQYPVPDSWEPILEKMCEYISDCRGRYGEIIAFGDNDDGKILDLNGAAFDHYEYVLGLFSLLLPNSYIEVRKSAENLTWLFTANDFKKSRSKPIYEPEICACYREGGVSILRSKDKQVLIGIDHGELGFSSIAAHGHADALSFRMYVKGKPLFIDPGTYIYHTDLTSRNAYRKTKNHNTVCVDGRDQSEMLGAFLWGKRAKCRLLIFRETEEDIYLSAEHDGYHPEIHKRTFVYNKTDELVIKDEFQTEVIKELNFILARQAKVECDNKLKTVKINLNKLEVKINFDSDAAIELSTGTTMASNKYGKQHETPTFTARTNGKSVKTRVKIAKR